MNKYRKKEAVRIEGDRNFRSKMEKETQALETQKKKVLEARKLKEERLSESEKKLKECKRSAHLQKEQRRMMVEKHIDTIVDSMKKGTATPEIEREISRKKFQIRSKIEEFWKKMDLYENCLLGIEMERKSSRNGENKEKGSSADNLQVLKDSKDTGSNTDYENYKEQKKILEELLLRHREAFVANENKLKHIDTAIESCKKKYNGRLEQSNLLLKELKDQKALTTNLIEQEQATEENRLRSDSELVHTLRYVSSVSSPLHLEQEIYADSNEASTVFNYNDTAFEEGNQHDSKENTHPVVVRTPSKAEKLEVRKDKYEGMIKDAERSVIELKNARALELDQYNIERAEAVELCNKIKERIENDRVSLMRVTEEVNIDNLNKLKEEKEMNHVDSQKKKLLESRMKIVELFEKSMQNSINEATTEIKELHRTSWGGFGLSRSHRYSGINDFLTCVMRSVEIYNLDEIAEIEAELTDVKVDLNSSDIKLKEIEDKETSIQNTLLQQLQKRKVRSDLARVKHYQEISRSVEQLLTIAEGKDPSKVTMHLSKEAQHLAKSREKLEELEQS